MDKNLDVLNHFADNICLEMFFCLLSLMESIIMYATPLGTEVLKCSIHPPFINCFLRQFESFLLNTLQTN